MDEQKRLEQISLDELIEKEVNTALVCISTFKFATLKFAARESLYKRANKSFARNVHRMEEEEDRRAAKARCRRRKEKALQPQNRTKGIFTCFDYAQESSWLV